MGKIHRWLDADGNPLECHEPGCNSDIKVQGFCRYHYKRHMYHKSLPLVLCDTAGCEGEVLAGGMCRSCLPNERVPYQCFVPGCLKDSKRLSLCPSHYDAGWYDPEIPEEDQPLSPCSVFFCERGRASKSVFCKRCRDIGSKYKISTEDMRWFYSEENYRCRNQACGSTQGLHMDHDHQCCPPGTFTFGSHGSCGKCNRGWLCRKCNTGLGQFNDDVDLILGAIEALKTPVLPPKG